MAAKSSGCCVNAKAEWGMSIIANLSCFGVCNQKISPYSALFTLFWLLDLYFLKETTFIELVYDGSLLKWYVPVCIVGKINIAHTPEWAHLTPTHTVRYKQ